jgi:phosphoglycerol transferase MdoB-like AlkP superfamily enzyme
MNNQPQNYNGLGFPGALFLVFLVLKLTGFIGWSWWWITAPLWVMALLLFVLLIIAIPILILREASKKR